MHVNTAKPPTDDLRVRQALLMAMDRQAIIDAVFMGYSPPAFGPLNRATWGYDPSVEALYSYDGSRPNGCWRRRAGVIRMGMGSATRTEQSLTLETLLMGWGYLPEVGQMLQEQYRQVGIQLEMQVLAFPAAVQAAAEGQHHLIPFTLSSSDPHILRSSYHSSQRGPWL